MLSIVDVMAGRRFSVRQEVQTQPGARTLALDATNGRVYLPSGVGDTFVVDVVGKAKTR